MAGLFLAACTQPAQQTASTPAGSPALRPSPTLLGESDAVAAAIAACVALCENADIAECGSARLTECGPWLEGPCLSDAAPGKMPSGWVCDVAHSPRESVDDEPENQCAEYRSGAARHFVEVDVECKVIRAV
ncbi:MAG: hypothetical protein QW343_03155 [Candidatus Norongarragalinales archaeon]